MTRLPSLVWADLRSEPLEPSPVAELKVHFRLQHVVEVADIPASIEGTAPLLACFEFDYPNLPALKALRATKQSNPHLPILMLTLHHSEALAVWAFRAQVWDFLVKPLSAEDLWTRIQSLLAVLPSAREPGRAIAMPAPLIPQEARVGTLACAGRPTEAALAYVQRHYADVLRLDDVARCCHMSPYEFSRRFKHVHGLTFREYLCQYRLKRALEMLSNPHATIFEVACSVGFRNASHFTRLFRQRVGVTPSQYRLTPCLPPFK